MDYNLPYSINLAGKGAFDQALAAVNVFLTDSNLNETSRKAGEYRQGCYRFALDYAASHPTNGYSFHPQNMGDSINSEVSEYYPTITIDGDADRVNPGTARHAKKFTGPHEHRIFKGAGHNLPQERPEEWARAVIGARKMANA